MKRLKLVHVNNVANVGANLVSGMRRLSVDADIEEASVTGGNASLSSKLILHGLPRLKEYNRLIKVARDKKYDVVHIHYAYLGWIGILAHRSYYLHCHGTDIRLDLNHPIRKVWTRQSIIKARKVFYSTPDLYSFLRPIRPDAVFLPNPILTDQFFPTGNFERKEGVRVLIFCAFNDEIKGVDLAIEALRLVREHRPGLSVSAIAMGKDLSKYRGIEWINWLDHLPYAEIPGVINQHDIILGQFRFGILSMSELESMACGKPVICSWNAYPCYPEQPPIYPAHNVAEITSHLNDLIESSQRRIELGRKARRWVIEYHDYVAVARRLLSEYAIQSKDLKPI